MLLKNIQRTKCALYDNDACLIIVVVGKFKVYIMDARYIMYLCT